MATIAIVDAEAAESTPLALALRAEGHQVQVIHEGTEALAHLRAAPPQVIVLSVELPQTSGYSLCNKIKRDPILASISLLLVSSQATAETFEEHKRLRTRADAYGRKPYDIGQVIQIVASLLGQVDAREDAVERTEQARVSDVASAQPSKAVRFGEDPSVRDISHAPFLQHDHSGDTAVLGQGDLAEAGSGDARLFEADQALSDEQRWVEQALQARITEPGPPPPPPLGDAPTEASPEPAASASPPPPPTPTPTEPPFPADAHAFPLQSEAFESTPTPAPPSAAESVAEPAAELPDSRDTRLDPPKPRRRRSTGKKAAAAADAPASTDADAQAELASLRQQVAQLEAALADAAARAPSAYETQAQWAAIDAQSAALSEALAALQQAHDALLQQLQLLRPHPHVR